VDELRKISDICRKHGVKVIADEIHCDFTWSEFTHTPFMKACPEMVEDMIICTAPSKSFNLAGLQTSNIIIPGQALREAWQKEMLRINYHAPNSLGLRACQAAYEEGAQWLDECKSYMQGNLDYVRDFLKENLPMIKLVEPEGTYLAWLDCSGLGLSKEALDDLMIRKANLWLDTGSIFGECARQFQRVVLACPRATLEKAMEQLASAVDSL
jgi:cystathionine beta-lyase